VTADNDTQLSTAADAADLITNADRYLAALEAYQLAGPDAAARMATAMEGARRQKLAERPDSLLSIMMLGASGAGKSELLNALAGARIARSHHARPTTTRPTIYAHEDIPAERLFEFGTTLGSLAADPAAIVRHRREELRHKILIDAPDIDSFRTGHRQLVLELMPAVDVVLYVVTGWTYRDDIGWKTVLEGRGHRAVGFVMNKWDNQGRPPCRSGEVDVDEDFLRLLHTGGWDEPLLFRTSAAYWAAARSHSRPETEGMEFLQGPPPSGDEFPALQEWLAEGLSGSEIAQIQRRKRRGLWGDLAAAVSLTKPRLGALEQFQSQVDVTLQDTRTRVLDLLRQPIEEAARLTASRQRQEESPETPGPYGQVTRLGRSLIQGLSAIRQAIHPFSSITGSASAVSANSSSGAPSPYTPGSALETLVERAFRELSWQARQQNIPLSWLEQQWDHQPRQVATEINESIQYALTQTPAHREPWRRKLARTVAWTLDITLLVAVAATAWRLTVGLVLGQPSTAGFVLSFVTLVGCVVVLGNTAMALLLPDRSGSLARALSRSTDQAVTTALGKPRQMARTYLADLREVEQLAKHLEDGINQQIASLQQDIAQTSSQQPRPDTTGRLYASATH
jgi:hypothetical protein